MAGNTLAAGLLQVLSYKLNRTLATEHSAPSYVPFRGPFVARWGEGLFGWSNGDDFCDPLESPSLG